jgi:membrane-associated phospholipid phosphatase
MNPRLRAATLALLVAAIVLAAGFAPFDSAISGAAQALPSPVVGVSAAITDFGTFTWMIGGSALVALVGYAAANLAADPLAASRARTLFRVGAFFLASTAAASALVHLAKFLIGRARPEMAAEFGAWSLSPFARDIAFQSFPSGHSAAAGAFFAAMALVLPRHAFLFVAGALTIGITRVVVGAHYPSDVAAGLALGAWASLAAAYLMAARGWLFRLDDKGWPRPKNAPRPGSGDGGADAARLDS